MRKILVCGSAGFLMSNLMRYMLYRTKDYEFVSVDILRGRDDSKNVYLNRKHSFHIGDAGDTEFMDKLVWMEKPDIIVIGTTMMVPPRSIPPPAHKGIREVLLPTAAACRHATHGLYSSTWKWPYVIRLVPDRDVVEMGDRAMWEHVESMVLEAQGTVLRLPVCFGRRGNGWFEDALRTIVLGQTHEGWSPDAKRKRYAYAEDVASMLWFLMENPYPKQIIRMPALCYASPLDMLVEQSDGLGGIEPSTVEGWEPDSKDIQEAVAKTVKWYMMNKWVFRTSCEETPLVSTPSEGVL